MDGVQMIELELQELSEGLTAPGRQECLWCYLHRMLGEFGCAGHRFTRRWADSRRRGTPDGLVRWAAAGGGCCCDCEVIMNSLSKPGAQRRGGALCAAAVAMLAQDEDGPLPACSGVPGGC